MSFPMIDLSHRGRKRREIEHRKIAIQGLKPECCPLCRMESLWPAPRLAMNACSRLKAGIYVCSPCGELEVGLQRKINKLRQTPSSG